MWNNLPASKLFDRSLMFGKYIEVVDDVDVHNSREVLFRLKG